MARASRKYFLLILGLGALAVFIYKSRNSIALAGFSWKEVIASLREANPALLLGAIGVIFLCYAARAARWMRFSRWIGPSRFPNVYSSTLMGFTCIFLLGRAGEPIRPVLIARKDSLPVSGMFGVYIVERIFDMGATAVLAGIGLLFFRHSSLDTQESARLMALARTAGAGLLLGLALGISFLLYFRYYGGEWLSRRLKKPAWHRGWRQRVAAIAEGFSDGLRGIHTWDDLAVLVGYTLLHWFGVAVCYFLVIRAFGGDLSGMGFLAGVVVLAFTLVGSALQLPAVGGGAQAASFLVLTLFFGIAKEPAAVVAIVMWIISFASCSIAGLPLLLREGWSMGELQRLARAEEKTAEATEAGAWGGGAGRKGGAGQ
jgi:glycosyltransferase 2 family protein